MDIWALTASSQQIAPPRSSIERMTQGKARLEASLCCPNRKLLGSEDQEYGLDGRRTQVLGGNILLAPQNPHTVGKGTATEGPEQDCSLQRRTETLDFAPDHEGVTGVEFILRPPAGHLGYK